MHKKSGPPYKKRVGRVGVLIILAPKRGVLCIPSVRAFVGTEGGALESTFQRRSPFPGPDNYLWSHTGAEVEQIAYDRSWIKKTGKHRMKRRVTSLYFRLHS